MGKPLILLITSFVVLAAGCQHMSRISNAEMKTPTPVVDGAPIAASQPPALIAPVSTTPTRQESPTPLPTGTRTAETPQTTGPDSSCALVHSQMPKNFLKPGNIIYYNPNFDVMKATPETRNLLILDAMPGVQREFLTDWDCCLYLPLPDHGVSTDQKWTSIEYENIANPRDRAILLTNGDEQSTQVYRNRDFADTNPFLTNWVWLSDHQFFLIPKTREGDQIGEKLILVDLNNQELHSVFYSLPGILPLEYQFLTVGWRGAEYPVYNSKMTRAVYYQWPDSHDLQTRAIVLWDLERMEPFWTYPLHDPPDWAFEASVPAWSPDGNQFIIAVQNQNPGEGIDVYLIQEDGTIQKLDIPTPTHAHDGVGGVSWSPDGQFVAYFAEYSGSIWFNILDMNNLQSWTTCVSEKSENLINPVYLMGTPLWSPDSSQVIVNFGDYHDQRKSENYVVDVHRKEVAVIPYPFGNYFKVWLAPVQ